MRVVNVRIDATTMPKDDPEWRFALAATSETHGFVVRIETDDGPAGIGYTTAAPHVGAHEDLVARGLRRCAHHLVGRDPREVSALLADLDALEGVSENARAGLDLALHDLAGKTLGLPLYRLLGGLARERVDLLRILAIKEPAAVARNAEALVAEGYRYLKIKLEGDRVRDVGRVRAVREAVGPAVHLTVDANQSYRPDDAIAAIREMTRYGIDLVEQPVAAADVDGLARVARSVGVVVEADESALGLADVVRLVSLRAVGSVSLKLPKLGGLRKAQAAAAVCAAGGVRCRVGAHVGSRLLAAAALHFAAATPNVWYACELAEFARLRDDPAEGLEVERGTLRVPDDAGVGARLRAAVPA